MPRATPFLTGAYAVVSLNYLSGYARAFFFFCYLRETLSKHAALERVGRVLNVLGALTALAVVLNLRFHFFFAFDAAGLYVPGDVYWLANLYPGLTLAVCAVAACACGELAPRDKAAFVAYTLFPTLGMLADFYVETTVVPTQPAQPAAARPLRVQHRPVIRRLPPMWENISISRPPAPAAILGAPAGRRPTRSRCLSRAFPFPRVRRA